MQLRNLRMSDKVAAVCVPATLVMCLHLLLVTPNLQSLATPQPYRGAVEPRTRVVVGAPTNRTGEAREDVLLVTPLLRCGGTTIRNLLHILAPINNFTMLLKAPTKAEFVHIPHEATQRDLVEKMSSFTSPTAIMHSFSFINFTKFGRQKPVRVSLVREPVERAISWFYHVRAPFQLVERHTRFPEVKLPTRKFLKKDLETCLKNQRDPECRYTPGTETLGHTVEFFCGHDPYCPIFGSREGLQQAKTMVEREFAVVGVLEEWDKTLAVLEHYIPRYFAHASAQYYEVLHGNKRKKNENFYKPKVEPWAKKFLRANFTVEAEFYDFVRQRLNHQYQAITSVF